jgi:hypothetical protein
VHLQVKIRLSSHDWDSINADVTLARTVDQTFLTIDNDTISDTSGESWVSIMVCQGQVYFQHCGRAVLLYDTVWMSYGSGNFVVPIIDGEGRLAAFYTPDQTPPRLLNYTINMDSGKPRFELIEIRELGPPQGITFQ